MVLTGGLTDGSARAEGDVGEEGRVGFRGFVGQLELDPRGPRSSPAASTFPAETSLDGKKTEKASIILGDGTLRLETKSGQAKEFRLDAIDTLSYSFSKQPRGKAAIGIGILCLPCGIATAFLKKKKHWLSWKAEGEGAAVVALEIDALAPGGVAPAGDTVEIVRVVDGRGHGHVAGLRIRASARFCAAHADNVPTRLSAARLFDGSG